MDGDERVVEIDLPGGWVAEMQWPEGVTNGGPAVLLVRPADPESYPHGGVSSTLLREIDFKYAADRLRGQLAASERRQKFAEGYDNEQDDRIRAALADGVTDEYLALLSSRYVRITGAGQAKPLKALADVIGKTESTVKGHLWQARKRGLLEGSQGRAGGQLTEKATRLLAP